MRSVSLASLAFLMVTCGCAPSALKYGETKERKNFFFPVRQGAPEPIYNRLTYVYPPSPLPERRTPETFAPMIFPIIHLDLKDTTLEEASRIIASSARYSSYCSSLVADKRVTVEGLGTVDELAKLVGETAGIHAVVDHENREVRFMSNGIDSLEAIIPTGS